MTKVARIFNRKSQFSRTFIDLELKTHKKLGLLRLEKICQNFEKVQITTFSIPKIAKNYPSKRSKWACKGTQRWCLRF